MPFDDDAEEDLWDFRPPPDPEDRLWRHPSEIGVHPVISLRTAVPTAAPAAPSRSWGLIVVAATMGAMLAGAGVLAIGLGERIVERPVVSQVALNPVASLPGHSDATVTDQVRTRVAPAVVALRPAGTDTAAGSGVVIRDDGIVLTSMSILEQTDPGTPMTAQFEDGHSADGELVGVDPATGLGVVDLAGISYTTAVLAPTSGLSPGDGSFIVTALADGPAAHRTTVGTTDSKNSRLDGTIAIHRPDDEPPLALGAPVLDQRGAVVAVVTVRRDGVVHATPVEVARRVSDDLITNGHAMHPWLGVEGTDATADPDGARAAALTRPGAAGSTEPAGALLTTVVDNGPSDHAGLRSGDVIVALEDQPVARMDDLVVALRAQRPGDRAELVVRRDGTLSTVTARLAEPPAAASVDTTTR